MRGCKCAKKQARVMYMYVTVSLKKTLTFCGPGQVLRAATISTAGMHMKNLAVAAVFVLFGATGARADACSWSSGLPCTVASGCEFLKDVNGDLKRIGNCSDVQATTLSLSNKGIVSLSLDVFEG